MGNFIFGGGSKSLNKSGLLTYRGRRVLSLSFTLQPQAKTVDEYALATFSCEATGGVAPYTYQWKKNGTNVGTNSAALSFTAVAADNGASITVVVTDSAGAVIASTPAVLGVTSYIYQLDGVTQRFLLSTQITIPASTDFEIEITDKLASTSFDDFRVFGNSANFQSRILVRPNGSISVRPSSGEIFNLPAGTFTSFNSLSVFKLSRVGGVTTLNINGITYTVSGTALNTYNIDSIGYSGGFYALDAAKGLKVTLAGSLVNNLPLNNKSQGANQLATVGSINATIVNYNANGWVAI